MNWKWIVVQLKNVFYLFTCPLFMMAYYFFHDFIFNNWPYMWCGKESDSVCCCWVVRRRVGYTVFVEVLGSWGSWCFFSRCLWTKWWITSLSPISVQLPALPLPSSSSRYCSVGKWMGLLFAASASHSVKLHHASGADEFVCMCVLSVCLYQ